MKLKISKAGKHNILRNPFADPATSSPQQRHPDPDSLPSSPLSSSFGTVDNRGSSYEAVPKAKRVQGTDSLLFSRDPFADSQTEDHFEKFLDQYGDGGEDCDDEARIVQARRDTLAVLDPANAASSRVAEFNSYTKMRRHYQLRKQLVLEQEQQEQEDLGRLETQRLCEEEHVPQQDPYQSHSMTNSTSSEIKGCDGSVPTSTIPEIAIRTATPSPPASNRSSRRRGSSLLSSNGKDGFLSTNYSPSPLSSYSSASDSLLGQEGYSEDREHDAINGMDVGTQGSLQKSTLKGSHRATTVYKSLFQRITPSAAHHPSNQLQNQAVGNKGSEGKEEGPVVIDHIGVELERASAKPHRNTFGRLTSSLQQHHRSQKKVKKNSKSKSISPFGLWDPCDNLLVPDTDDEASELKGAHDLKVTSTMEEDYASMFGPNEPAREHLRGSVGGRRSSEDHIEDYLSHASTRRPPKSLVSRFGRLGGKENTRVSSYTNEDEEDLMMNPRTAAIRGTFHRVNDSVSFPITAPFQGKNLEKNKNKDRRGPKVRSMRSISTPSSEYTTISLDSPPMPRVTSSGGGSSGLARAGSLDSSFKRMRQTASSFIASFGASVELPDHEDDKEQCLEDDCEKDDSSVVPDMDTEGSVTAYRSSSFTFGGRSSMSSSAPPPPQQPVYSANAIMASVTASTIESIKSLFSSSELAPLARKSSSPATLGRGESEEEGSSWTPFSPINYDLRRTQTTSFAEKGREGLVSHFSFAYPSLTPEHCRSTIGGSASGDADFSPIARRMTPAMVPMIVIPHSDPAEQSAQSATRVSFPSNDLENDLTTGEIFVPSSGDGDLGDAVPHTSRQPGLIISVAAAAMAAAQRARSEGYLNLAEFSSHKLISDPLSSPSTVHDTTSTTSPTSDEGTSDQSEQDSTHGREVGHLPTIPLPAAIKTRFPYGRNVRGLDSASVSSAMFSPCYSTSGSQAVTASSSATLLSASATEYGIGQRNDLKESPSRGRFGVKPDFFDSTEALPSTTVAMTSMRTVEINDVESDALPTQRQRQASGQSDTSEKFMQLPDPSRFEGMCSCRGIINITSMLLILCGLVLLILGYPIAASLRKDRLAAENAAASATGRAAAENGTNLGMTSGMHDSVTAKAAAVNDARRAAAFVDPDTPVDQRTRVAKDGLVWDLVFSDEFNQDGRSFRPGQDPFWESMELLPLTGPNSIEHYSHDAVSTKDGHLEIQIRRDPVPSATSMNEHSGDRDSIFAKRNLYKWEYTSGMLQSWNKLCFQGGILEVGVNIPASPSQPGLKPRIFVLGNLARYGYPATMDGVWPFSSTRRNESSMGTGADSVLNCTSLSSKSSQQRLNACSNNGISRGAPEMTLLDAHYGVDLGTPSINVQESAPYQRRQLQTDTLVRKQRLSSSTTVRSARIKSIKDKVSTTGRHGINIASVKVAALKTVRTNVSNVVMEVVQEASPTWIQPLSDRVFENEKTGSGDYEFTKVGLEYLPGSKDSKDGQEPYIQFMMDDTWQSPPIEANDRQLSQDLENTRLGAHTLPSKIAVPEEPMSIVLKLGMLQDELMFDESLEFPAVMRIDYVRLYQPPQGPLTALDSKGQMLTQDVGRLSCNPSDYPTKDYIERYPRAYQDPSMGTWSEAGYA